MQTDFERWLALMERQGSQPVTPAAEPRMDTARIGAVHAPLRNGAITPQAAPVASPAELSTCAVPDAARLNTGPKAASPSSVAPGLSGSEVATLDGSPHVDGGVSDAVQAAAAPHLTGDARADADILAFYAARARVLQLQ